MNKISKYLNDLKDKEKELEKKVKENLEVVDELVEEEMGVNQDEYYADYDDEYGME